MRFANKYSLVSSIYDMLVNYPSPTNLTYFWNFGFLAAICLFVQLFTGIFLAMYYTPHVDLAFYSIEFIMSDVNSGWLLRYMHSNGASMFFFCIYVHMFRGFFNGSYAYPRQLLWISGVIIFVLAVGTAFMGYVLPWGQMSFWAATVITSLLGSIPNIGPFLLEWVWGGFSVDNATLNSFFSIHYLLPFIVSIFAGLHLIFLHEYGSNNPLGVSFYTDRVPLLPYFILNDFLGFLGLLFIFGFFIFFYPNYLGHSDNYILANPLVTPVHIVPEWYFLPFYAILRAIPDKLLGFVAFVFAIVVLFLLPFIHVPFVRSYHFSPLGQFFIWLFLLNWFILGFIGGRPLESPYYEIGQWATFYYFLSFFFIFPFLSFLEYFFLYFPWDFTE